MNTCIAAVTLLMCQGAGVEEVVMMGLIGTEVTVLRYGCGEGVVSG